MTMTGQLLTVLLLLALGRRVSSFVDPREDHCDELDPEFQDALQEDLKVTNCLREVEIVHPDQVQRAARLFHRDGFVVVKDALTEEQIHSVGEKCAEIADEMLKRDPRRIGNRGPYRYSMGGLYRTKHVIHHPEIAQLVDLPNVTPVLKAIFGNDKYLVKGARGDFNLPNSAYQSLHADMQKDYLFDPAVSEFPDSGRLDYRDLPTFYVVTNFVLANLTALNAPIRQIPLTHQSHRVMPALDDEPGWMKRSTLCPVPAGSVIIRDARAWHGGTPNLSDGTRMLPNIEYFSYWYRFKHRSHMLSSLPRDVYDNLTPFGKELCHEIVANLGEEVDTSMVDNITILQGDAIPCYKKMGLTDADIEKYRQQGRLYDPTNIRRTRANFYGRKNATRKFIKDEL